MVVFTPGGLTELKHLRQSPSGSMGCKLLATLAIVFIVTAVLLLINTIFELES